MKKLIKLILVMGILILTGCVSEKNKIPDDLLGTYIQDAEYNYFGTNKKQGIAKIFKKGNRYYIEVNTNSIRGNEEASVFKLEANGKIEEIKYKEFETGFKLYGEHVKDIYNITFADLKTSGKDGDELKYDPRITLIGERKLKTKEDDIVDYNSYYMDFKHELKSISVLWIKGKKFKKIKE